MFVKLRQKRKLIYIAVLHTLLFQDVGEISLKSWTDAVIMRSMKNNVHT